MFFYLETLWACYHKHDWDKPYDLHTLDKVLASQPDPLDLDLATTVISANALPKQLSGKT